MDGFWTFATDNPGYAFLIVLAIGATAVGVVRGIGSWFHPQVCSCGHEDDKENDDAPTT